MFRVQVFRRLHFILFLGLVGLVAPASSQEEAGARSNEEFAAIRQDAEGLARDFVANRPQADISTLDTDSILREAERFSAEARALQESLTARLGNLTNAGEAGAFFDEDGRIDAGTLAAAAGDVARASRETGERAPLFVSFVSLSMPDAALTRIIRDTNEAGGLVVVRGFHGGTYGDFATRVRDLFDEGEVVGISIDPRYFQALGVTHVPAYAIVLGEPRCEGFVCAPLAADTVSGNISVAAALDLLAHQGSVAPAHARAALARIEGAL